ncbi:hypothetical protein PG991_012227 [Apiospora marii]|uniref:Uncharacterized protein n=1 Tax=Apiospora marii TaxID=335849 RepID=A0ABR1R987_9PEZI
MPSTTDRLQDLLHPSLSYGPARILAYICRPQPPPPSPSSTSASSTITTFSTPLEEQPYYYHPQLQILDHLYLHIPPSLPPGHHHSPTAFLQRALSSAVARHRYPYHDPHLNQRDFSPTSYDSGSPEDAESLASTDIAACDIRINLRQPPQPTVFGPLSLCTSWMRPLSTLGEDEFRGVLLDVAQNRGVAEVIVLLRPAVFHSDATDAADDDEESEAEGSDVDGDDNPHDSLGIYSGSPSPDSTNHYRGRSRSRGRHPR